VSSGRAAAGGPTACSTVIAVPQAARDLQEPRFERGLRLLQPIQLDAASDQHARHLGRRGARHAGRQCHRQSAGLDLGRQVEVGRGEQGRGACRLGAVDLQGKCRPGKQFRDRPLPDDLAAVDDGHGIAGPFHFVKQVRGEHDRAALSDQRQDHVAHLAHAGRIQPVHRLVQDQQLRIADQASGNPETLPHTHRVLRDAIVGAMQDADPLQRRLDAATRGRFARRGKQLQVLPTG
jgi:hypothetical protein